MVRTPVSVKSVSRVPLASNRAMAKLELAGPVDPAITIRPSPCRATAFPLSRRPTPFFELSADTDMVVVPLFANVWSGVPSGSRRITDSSMMLPGGEVDGVVSAVPTSTSRPSGCTTRSEPTRASMVERAARPKRGVGLAVGTVPRDIGVVVDAHAAAA
jgi:hypothetical protein